MWKERRAELVRGKFGMRMTCAGAEEKDGETTVAASEEEDGLVEVQTRPGREVELKLVIKNERDPSRKTKKETETETETEETAESESAGWAADPDKGVVLKSVSVLTEMDGFHLRDGFGVTRPERDREDRLRPGVRVLPGRKLSFALRFRKESVGQHRVPIVAQLRPYSSRALHFLALEVLVRVVSPEQLELEPREPYRPPRMVNRSWESVGAVAEPGWRPEMERGRKGGGRPKVSQCCCKKSQNFSRNDG